MKKIILLLLIIAAPLLNFCSTGEEKREKSLVVKDTDVNVIAKAIDLSLNDLSGNIDCKYS